MQVIIRDETASGRVTNELSLDVLTETITVRELIRSRVYQEVDDHNRRVRQDAGAAAAFNGLVTPTDDERTLNGPAVGKRKIREIDFKQQFAVACESFERNGFFILIGNKQVESLDEAATLQAGTAVSFVKLTPLVGG